MVLQILGEATELVNQLASGMYRIKTGLMKIIFLDEVLNSFSKSLSTKIKILCMLLSALFTLLLVWPLHFPIKIALFKQCKSHTVKWSDIMVSPNVYICNAFPVSAGDIRGESV